MPINPSDNLIGFGHYCNEARAAGSLIHFPNYSIFYNLFYVAAVGLVSKMSPFNEM